MLQRGSTSNYDSYQSDAWAAEYTTLGYLTGIMSLLSLAIQPRAKFIQAMLVSLLFTCTGAAVALLQIVCVVSARQHSEPPAPTVVGSSGSMQSVRYNSSASAVAAVWLFVTIWLANFVRAKRPQLMLPSIQYSIFSIVASTYAPQFPNMAAGENFVRRLLITFLTGFGVATGVSLFFIPMTSRAIAGKQMAGLLGLIKAALGAHGEYMVNISALHRARTSGESVVNDKSGSKAAEKEDDKATAAAKSLKGILDKTAGLFGKLKLEIGFARKEFGYGKLYPEDFSSAFGHLQEILLPIIGLSTFITIMQSAKEKKDEYKNLIRSDETIEAVRRLQTEEWDEVVSMSHESFAKLRGALVGGLTHVSYVLEFAPKPKAPKEDVEASGEAPPKPGDTKYADHLHAEVEAFHKHRETVIRRWCDNKGIDLPTIFWDKPDAELSVDDHAAFKSQVRARENQQQLYLVLYVEYLVYSIGKAILKMVNYADSKVADGTMKKKRFINPGWRTIKRLVAGSWEVGDTDNAMPDGNTGGQTIWVGDSLRQRKDPEHLPPTNIWQKVTHFIRFVPRILSSPEAAFAFRAAVATLSIGILAFLRQTYLFFLQQRGLWALIMTAISMGVHAGQGVFGFAARIFGTVVAMCASIVIWYIGYKHAAAILPVFYLYLCCGIWFIVKNPPYVIIGMISMVTAVLIIGYELQADKIGVALVTSNGQEYYDIYLLGPFRLASVCIGLAVAFIWTYFPYPVTTHSTLRKDLGSTLYILANYYSCVHTTVDTKLHLGSRVNDSDKASPMARLDKARQKVFGKCIVMLSRLREQSNFTKFELTIGGRFPKETYDEVIQSMQNVFNYMSLISYSANAFTTEQEQESEWLKGFRRLTADLNITSHDVTSTLCLVSASITNSQPLPPYLSVPKPFALAERMKAADPEVLSVKHVAEPCYAAFAVLEIASSLVTEEMAHIVRKVKDLVGEVDFSFHIISTNEDGHTTQSTLRENDKNEQDDEKEGKGKKD